MALCLARPRRWSSSTFFVAASVAALTNLSCLWRLPALMAQYGGSAFLALYALVVVLLGLPLLAGQLLIARAGNQDLVGAATRLTRQAPLAGAWRALAYVGLVTAALVFAVYSVVAAWSLAFAVRGVAGVLAGDTVAAASAYFAHFVAATARGWGWLILLVASVVAVAARGLNRGVEPVMRALLALMLIALLTLLGAGLAESPERAAAVFAFEPRLLSGQAVLAALGQAFFGLGLGTGIAVAFASYLPPRAPLFRLSLAIVALHLVVAVIGALVAALVLGSKDPDRLTGLQRLFAFVPAVNGSGATTAVFFVLVALVALTTAIALFEPLVQACERRSGLARRTASVYVGACAGALALVLLLSFGPLGGVLIAGYRPFDAAVWLAGGVLMPLTGLWLAGVSLRAVAEWRTRHGATRTRRSLAAAWLGVVQYPGLIALFAVLVYSSGAWQAARALWF